MSVKFVTSFSEEGYRLYGKTMLESFTEYVDAPIMVYYETKKPPKLKHKNIEWRSLSKVPGALDTLQAMQYFPMMKGEVNGQRYYQYDVFKFCRKIFAQCDAATRHDDILVWIDADVEFTNTLSLDWVNEQFKERPKGHEQEGLTPFVCVLKRPSWHYCSSFVAWDLKHEQSIPFWNAYFNLIITGQFLIMPQWDDAFLLEQVVTQMELDYKDLAGLIELPDGPCNVFDYVFETVATHAKGNLKHKPKENKDVAVA